MHGAALHLAPILAAEKSKVPFYVAGGVLVAWALIVSLGLGLRRANFPGSPQLERATIAVTVVLVLAAASSAVITSGSTAKAGGTAASSQPAPSTATTTSTQPAPSTSTQPAPSAPTATSTQPKATKGKPAAPAKAPAAVTSLVLTANAGGLLSYDTKRLSAKAGTVTITLKNNAPLEHNVTIAQGAKVIGATSTFQAGTRLVTVKLQPGTYVFYCSVPGHRQAGMEGTLSVS